MDRIQLETLIAGAIVPFVISLLKRWVKLTKDQIGLVVLFICFIIASIFELVESNFNWQGYLSKIVEVYGSSQLVYWAVLKTLDLDVRIEGSN